MKKYIDRFCGALTVALLVLLALLAVPLALVEKRVGHSRMDKRLAGGGSLLSALRYLGQTEVEGRKIDLFGLPAVAGGATTRLSEDTAITVIETADIGGTSANSGYLDMTGYDRVYAYVELGTWNSSDDLDTCKLQQATSSAGANVKDLTTSASGGNYDTDTPVDADGDFVILEARAEDFDVDGGFKFVRLLLEEDDNTGVDNVTAVVVRHSAKHPAAEKNGAASSGSQVYVTPS